MVTAMLFYLPAAVQPWREREREREEREEREGERG
jgi:hypothetical protein